MKKVLFPILALVLAFGLALPMTVMAANTIDKTLSQSDADLGDHITVTLYVTVEADELPATVVDMLPNALGYIGNFMVDSVVATPTVVGQQVSYTLTDVGTYIITFDAQVTSTEATEITVTNLAMVNSQLSNPSATADITLQPYAGFSKAVVTSTHNPWDVVPMHTDVHWLLLIEIENITGDEIATMEDVVVKDNLGGDLEMHLCVDGCDYFGKALPQPLSMTPDVPKKSGKTEKLHLSWDLADFDGFEQLYLEISTDVNPGQTKKDLHKNEYTSEGEHDLNSGATLKFTDPDTLNQLCAHTGPITVIAYDPEIP